MNLGFEEEVTCDARVTDLNGREIKADDTPEARLQSNAIQKKKGMVFERKFYNLKDGLYIFTSRYNIPGASQQLAEQPLVGPLST